MKNKKLIRLTESDLHRIVKESVKRVINEGNSANAILRRKKQKQDRLKNAIIDAFEKMFGEQTQQKWDELYWQEGRPMPNSQDMAREQYNKQYLEGDISRAIASVTTPETIERVFDTSYDDFVAELCYELER